MNPPIMAYSNKILTVLVAPNPEADQQTPHLLHSGVCSLSLFY